MPKIVKMDTLFQGAKQPRMNSNPATPREPKTTVQKTFPFELPPGLQVTPLEAEILNYLKLNPGTDYEKWPKAVRVPRTVENMRRKQYIRRKYEPTRYYLTREGTGIVTWLSRLLEQSRKA
jgi:hypothetical protein